MAEAFFSIVSEFYYTVSCQLEFGVFRQLSIIVLVNCELSVVRWPRPDRKHLL